MNFITRYMLYEDIHYAIEDSICRDRSRQEPDYIADLVKNLPCKLSSILKQYFHSAKFRIGGCYIHQKPLARFIKPTSSNNKASEIGDLLVVYREINPNGTEFYNALLLQAKKTDNVFCTPIKYNDEHQLRLYREWPKFKYERAGALNGKIRSITPKTITPGAQYLLINESQSSSLGHCSTTFWCAIPDDILFASRSFAWQLIDLIEFQTGKPFVPRKGNIDQWSTMIWDLISISKETVFNRCSAGYIKSPRTSGDFIELLLNHGGYLEINDNSSGISMLIIERDNSEGRADQEKNNML